MKKEEILSRFRTIPGVGREIADDFYRMGLRELEEIASRDPEKLYQELCELDGRHVDRCMLYVFRCAVYFCKNKKHAPELLKWWNWSDKNLAKGRI